jgi:TrmH family RNA methyltransferase
MITSPHNAKVQLVRALLGRPRERREQAAFVVEGVRLVEEALAAGWSLRFALHDAGLGGRGKTLLSRLAAAGVDLEPVAENLMRSTSETETPQGVLAVVEIKPLPIPDKLDFVLVPDAIRDPGNLGTLLRTAAAAGVQAVFLPPETADAFAPKVVRAGMGAHFRLPILCLDWDGLHARLEGLRIYLAEMEASTPSWQADFRRPLALIVGGEAEGASRQAIEMASEQVCIPMPGNAESLNAAVAGAILMFEVVRQRAS